MAYGHSNLFAGALKPRLQHSFQECISYNIMMKNDHFNWEKWLGLQPAMRSVNTLLQQYFLFFNEFSWCDHKLTKDLHTDFCITGHAYITLFHNQGYNGRSILSLLLHFDTVTDMTLSNNLFN